MLVAATSTLVAADDAAIIKEEVHEATAVRYGQAIATRYRVGAKIAAKGATVQNILVMVAVPLECAEQTAHVVEEDFSPHIEGVDFRTLPDDKRAAPNARQMLITISELPARQEAHALITYEVLTKVVLPPEETASLVIPAKPDRLLKPFLMASPYINVNHRKIREAVREALDGAGKEKPAADATASDDTTIGDKAIDDTAADDEDAGEETSPGYEVVSGGAEADSRGERELEEKAPAEGGGDGELEQQTEETKKGAGGDDAPARSEHVVTDWQRVEALYDYVLEHVEYEAGAQDKAALNTLQDGRGDCHGIAALFVAMCRTAKVPARMVWVDGHQYAEFYLETDAGAGHWYPVQSAGTRAFGEMPLPKVILQKGDNFRVPERRRERLRYASDYTMLLAPPKHKPKVTYVREQL